MKRFCLLLVVATGMLLRGDIASSLPARPRATGHPVGYTRTWDDWCQSHGKVWTEQAEKLLPVPVPETPDEWYLEFTRTGERYHYEKPVKARQANLLALFRAECVERKGRFLGKISDYLLAMCDQRSWTLSAHDRRLTNFNRTQLTIDLEVALYCRQMSRVLAFLGDRLPPETVARVRAEIKRHAFDIYLARSRDPRAPGATWFECRNNWNPVCHNGVVQAALALVEDRVARAEFVEAAVRASAFYLEGFTDDGYCSEGVGYWDFGFEAFLELALTLRDQTGGEVDLFRNPKVRAILEYGLGIQIEPGRAPQFSDGEGQPSRAILFMGCLAYPDFVFPRKTLPSQTWFPDAQVLVSRSAPGGRPLGVAAKGGHNDEHHNHNDVGSYQLFLDGVVMAGDPQPEIYTSRTFSKDRYVSHVLSSYGHPVPLPAGTRQSPGRRFAGRTVSTSFTGGRDEFAVDLTAAYDCPSLTSLQRTVVHDRTRREVTVTDRVRFRTPQAFETPIVTYCAVKDGETAGGFVLEGEAGRRVAVSVEASTGAWLFVDETLDNPGRKSFLRRAVRFDVPVAEASVTVRYRAE